MMAGGFLALTEFTNRYKYLIIMQQEVTQQEVTIAT
jgi:hypothetical protein